MANRLGSSAFPSSRAITEIMCTEQTRSLPALSSETSLAGLWWDLWGKSRGGQGQGCVPSITLQIAISISSCL